MFKKLDSKRGISPILATLLLIVIAVAAIVVTYAWVITFTTTQTQQAGAVLTLENVRFYKVGTTQNRTDVVLRNTGTASAKVVAVYWSGSSFAALSKLVSSEYAMDPTTGVVNTDSSITVTIKWGVSGGVITSNEWISGSTYYFKVVTEGGQYLQFTAKAP